MQWQDMTLFAKKVLLGIVLTVVPLVILFGGLRLTRQVLATGKFCKAGSSAK